MSKNCPTKRAPDAGDSGEIPSSFLRLFIFHIGRLRRPPAPARVTQTVGLLRTGREMIKKINLIACLIIFSSSACTNLEGNTAAPDPLSTSTPANISTQEIKLAGFVPETQEYCPENREIGLSNLGLDPSLAMIVEYYPSTFDYYDGSISENGLYLLHGNNAKMTSIRETIPPTGWNYVYRGMSTSRKWLLVERSEDSGNSVSVWVTPVDRQDGHEVLEAKLNGDFNFFELDLMPTNGHRTTVGPMSRSWGTKWVGNQIELAGKYVDSTAMDPQFPYFHIDPFTFANRIIDTDKLYTGVSYPYSEIFINGHEYVIYYGDLDSDFHQKEFILQNKDDYSQVEVFKWLRGENWIDMNLLNGRLRIWSSNTEKVNVAVVQDYGFDLGMNIEVNELTNETIYTNAMKPIFISPNNGHLPDGYMAFLSIARSTSENGQLFSIYSVNDQSNILIFDSNKMVLRDYCLSAFRIHPLQIVFSPDNKFIAWNSFNEDKNEVILYIMDLETGFVTHVEGVRFRDWAIIN